MVRGLLDCGASVTVVAPAVEPELLDLNADLKLRAYADGDLTGRWLVVAATPDRDVNRTVYEEAERRGIFCNVADDPELCSLILPAVHRVDPIAIAVSTGGASPALAQRLRRDIAEVVGPEHARLARQLRSLRPWAQAQLPTYDERREYFESLVERALP
jgi:siroheme synthase-like protein